MELYEVAWYANDTVAQLEAAREAKLVVAELQRRKDNLTRTADQSASINSLSK
jgi:hypothetical protein